MTPSDIPRFKGLVSEQSVKSSRRRFQHYRLSQLYIITDAIALLLGFICSQHVAKLINVALLRRGFTNPLTEYDAAQFLCLTAIAVGTLMRFQYKGHYRVRINFWLEMRDVVCTIGFAMLLDGFLQFATKNDPSRLWLMVGWVVAAIAILSFRGLLRTIMRRTGLWYVPTLLVGGGYNAADTAAVLATENKLGFDIVARIVNLPEAFMQAGRSWERLCAAHGVEYIIVALDGLELEHAEQPIAQLMRESIPFSISPPRRHLPVLDMVPQYFFNSDVKLLTRHSGLEQPLPRLIKRLFDIVVSGMVLLLLSPAMLMIAVMVKRDGGPVFFGHRRIGKGGKAFYCLKFRTMIAGSADVLRRHLEESPEAKAEWDATHKLKNDPRITRFGAFLRSSSLDELPQLINVLRGQMSLVGPRPIVKAEIKKYQQDIAHYYRVSPGVTGLWQVSGRNDVTYEQRVQMDSWYVRNWSLWHDIAILCKTFPALLKRHGAY